MSIPGYPGDQLADEPRHWQCPGSGACRERWQDPAGWDVLAGLRHQDDNPWVIAGKVRCRDTHITDLQKPWRRIRARAGDDSERWVGV